MGRVDSKRDCCVVPNCSNTRSKCKNLSFFRFPNESGRLKVWANNCCRSDLLAKTIAYINSHCRVCSQHFDDYMFANLTRNRLHTFAVPTIFDASNTFSVVPCPQITVEDEDPEEIVMKTELIEDCQSEREISKSVKVVDLSQPKNNHIRSPRRKDLCAVATCTNSKNVRKELSFFKFPNELKRAKQWAINSYRADLLNEDVMYLHKNFIVCAEHFEDYMFSSTSKNRLKQFAVPTICNKSRSPSPTVPPTQNSNENVVTNSNLEEVLMKSEVTAEDSSEESEYFGNPVINDEYTDYEMQTEKKDPLKLEAHLDQKAQIKDEVQTEQLKSDVKDNLQVDQEDPKEDCSVIDSGIIDVSGSPVNQEKMDGEEIIDLSDDSSEQDKNNRQFSCKDPAAQHTLKLQKNTGIEKTQYIKCYICDFKTIDKKVLIDHMKKHVQINMFKCLKCPFESNRVSELMSHDSKEHNPNVKSSRKESVKVKYRVYSSNNYKCNKCEFHTNNKHTLTLHHLTHAELKGRYNTYSCSMCRYETSAKYLLTRHMASRHTNLVTLYKIYPCQFCNYQFVRMDHFKKHLKTIHPEEKRFKCHICARDDLILNSLKKHLKSHTRERKYQCKECNYFAKSHKLLTRHNKLVHKMKLVFLPKFGNASTDNSDHSSEHVNPSLLSEVSTGTSECKDLTPLPNVGADSNDPLKDDVQIHTDEKRYAPNVITKPSVLEI